MVLLAILLLLPAAVLAQSGPTFPPLAGRVVDQANLLPAAQETALTDKLDALEASTGRQLVVATIPSLQGYEIEEYGYRLGRTWGLGSEKADDGLILLVAPKERRVRIEVGYGLEGVVTDAVSSQILSQQVLPRFRADDYPGGITAGADALIQLLSLPSGEARARAEAAERRPAPQHQEDGIAPFIIGLILFIVIMSFLRGASGRRRYRGGGGGWVVPAIVWAANSRSGGGWTGGGGGWSGGGGFSGGGGSFGGGGASGSW